MADQDVRTLEAQIDKLVVATKSEQAALKRASITALLISVALLVIVLVFVFVNYTYFKSEWTEEKLSAGLQKEFHALNPTATLEMQALGKHLLPIYAQESRKQLVDLTPEITKRLQEEIDLLGHELQTDVNAKLQAADARIRERTRELVFASYPDLRKDSEREALTASFLKTTEAAVAKTANEFTELFSKDIEELENAIRAFEKAESKQPTIELQKKFIHLWLQLLDAEIMKL